jgi:hypothetical protein
MEELYSLLLIIGHVIADEGEGEMPLVCGCSFSLFYDTEMFFSKLQIFFFFLNERNLNRQKKLQISSNNVSMIHRKENRNARKIFYLIN